MKSNFNEPLYKIGDVVTLTYKNLDYKKIGKVIEIIPKAKNRDGYETLGAFNFIIEIVNGKCAGKEYCIEFLEPHFSITKPKYLKNE